MDKLMGKILSINLGLFGSTGTMMTEIGKCARESGYNYLSVIPYYDGLKSNDDVYLINSKWEKKIDTYLTLLTGADGSFAWFSTHRLIKWMDKQSPDIIHLHNIHFSFLNYALLFNYIKKRKISVIWTLHDCWSFTGHCPHFIYEKCERWKTGCFKCPRYSEYPKSLFDNSRFMWKRKRKCFTNLPHMTIVTPSQWLANLVKQSFLKSYPTVVINNGINLDVFKPTHSYIRERYGIGGKIIVLGVSFGWSNKKGLDVFIQISQTLSDDYQVVLVGTDETIEKQLPKNIISISLTKNQTELAGIYTTADVFVNPTREDTFPTVNIEALACGTPVITFRTGGSSEMLDDSCGSVVDCDDVDALIKEIIIVSKNKPYTAENCIKKALSYNRYNHFKEYVDLYETTRNTRNSSN